MYTTRLNHQAPDFVYDLSRRFPSLAERAQYLRTVSLNKLEQGLRILDGHIDASSECMRSLIVTELRSR
jgi:hypothetical protein